MAEYTHQIAYADDILIATVEAGQDIAAAVTAETEKTGIEFSDYAVETVRLSDDDDAGEGERLVFVSSGQTGWLPGMAKYAIAA